MYSDFLFLIPARGGSKGIPQKNIKELCGKPLIHYTLDSIINFVPIENICVSTDDQAIIDCVNKYGIQVPFIRPKEFATDKARTNEVIEHALSYYSNINKRYRGLVLLQPTSPLRSEKHVKEALSLYSDNIDLVVSVKITSSNPYYVLFEDNEDGFLVNSKVGSFVTRQECPIVYERNGALFVYNLASDLNNLKRQKKYIMEDECSVDIDNPIDWILAEALISKSKIK
jgi:CMP-N,N'-diacetyllegionaminic acid synthase